MGHASHESSIKKALNKKKKNCKLLRIVMNNFKNNNE